MGLFFAAMIFLTILFIFMGEVTFSKSKKRTQKYLKSFGVKFVHCDFSDYPRPNTLVWDDLMDEPARVKRVISDRGGIGYVLNNSWVGGYRYPWEISKLKQVRR